MPIDWGRNLTTAMYYTNEHLHKQFMRDPLSKTRHDYNRHDLRRPNVTTPSSSYRPLREEEGVEFKSEMHSQIKDLLNVKCDTIQSLCDKKMVILKSNQVSTQEQMKSALMKIMEHNTILGSLEGGQRSIERVCDQLRDRLQDLTNDNGKLQCQLTQQEQTILIIQKEFKNIKKENVQLQVHLQSKLSSHETMEKTKETNNEMIENKYNILHLKEDSNDTYLQPSLKVKEMIIAETDEKIKDVMIAMEERMERMVETYQSNSTVEHGQIVGITTKLAAFDHSIEALRGFVKDQYNELLELSKNRFQTVMEMETSNATISDQKVNRAINGFNEKLETIQMDINRLSNKMHKKWTMIQNGVDERCDECSAKSRHRMSTMHQEFQEANGTVNGRMNQLQNDIMFLMSNYRNAVIPWNHQEGPQNTSTLKSGHSIHISQDHSESVPLSRSLSISSLHETKTEEKTQAKTKEKKEEKLPAPPPPSHHSGTSAEKVPSMMCIAAPLEEEAPEQPYHHETQSTTCQVPEIPAPVDNSNIKYCDDNVTIENSLPSPPPLPPSLPPTLEKEQQLGECLYCKSDFPLEEMEFHQDECDSRQEECKHCTVSFVVTEIVEHEMTCDQQFKQCPHCLRKNKLIDMKKHIEGCDCRLVSCPQKCGGKFLNRSLKKHLESCKLAVEANDIIKPPLVLECKYCDEQFSQIDLLQHQMSCDWIPKRCKTCNMVIISRDLFRHEESCVRTCPHCKLQGGDDMEKMQQHIQQCSKRPIKCIRCDSSYRAESIEHHSKICPRKEVDSNEVIHASDATPLVRKPKPPQKPPLKKAAWMEEVRIPTLPESDLQVNSEFENE